MIVHTDISCDILLLSLRGLRWKIHAALKEKMKYLQHGLERFEKNRS